MKRTAFAALVSLTVMLLGCGAEERTVGPPIPEFGITRTLSYDDILLAISARDDASVERIMALRLFHGVTPLMDVSAAEKHLGVTARRSGLGTLGTSTFLLPDVTLQLKPGVGRSRTEVRALPEPPDLPSSSLFNQQPRVRLRLSTYMTITIRTDRSTMIIHQPRGSVEEVVWF